jgi:Cu/Ag efflux pump CusA
VQINLIIPPGNSLDTSNRIARMAEERLKNIRGVVAFGRRTGRAELDEHAEGVNMSEIIVSFDPKSARSRDEILADIREELTQVPGAVIAVEQPMQHVISQMLSGVKAQVGIKLYGDHLEILRKKADEIKEAIETVPGIRDLMVEQQTEIPQLRIELDRQALASHVLNSNQVNELI